MHWLAMLTSLVVVAWMGGMAAPALAGASAPAADPTEQVAAIPQRGGVRDG